MQKSRPWFLFLAVLALCAFPLGAFTSSPTANVVLATMQQELQRATKSLAKTDPAPYYLSYAVTDTDETDVAASNGSVIFSASIDRRQADVMMRVGSVALDNTHSQSRGSGITSGLLPLNDDSSAIARVLWQLTDREYEQASADRSYLATSEGTALIRPGAIARLVIQAETRADDGMELMRVESFQAASPSQLPSDAELALKVDKIATDLKALRAAPAADPYAGPAMLSGRAAAVFFHEVLGHRLEGHRQRDENEGQTFTKKVNQLVLPAFLSVADDPTMKELNGVQLAGHYDFDDEGVPAMRVVAVENGVLKNFLMSRMPIKNFSQSNGHGRRQPGLMPTGRQGNLIVTSTNTVKDSELREKFVAEIKKQGKPYGLYFDDIQGGFTLTGRSTPQAFQVIPVMVYRVYADGRPDELVRGVDIVGTPLLSLNNIVLTGDTLQVFNGICGAESGQVPVAAAAPAMLFSEIEVQKRRRGSERPPVLPPPGFESTASAAPPANATKAAAAGAKP